MDGSRIDDGNYEYNYFTDHEVIKMEQRGIIIDQYDTKFNNDTYKNIYNKLKIEYTDNSCPDNNCTIYKSKIDDKPPVSYYEDIGKYESKNGFEYFVLPGETKFFKGSKYFYDTIPSKHFWVGCQRLAMFYAEQYGGGVVCYAIKKPIYLVLLTENNLKKIYNEANSNIQDDLRLTFGIDTTITEQAKNLSRKNILRRDIYLYNKHYSSRPKPPIKSQYMPVFRRQEAIHKYLYDKYNFDGTFIPYNMSPFHLPVDEIVNLNINENMINNIYIDESHPVYWKTWGLKLPEKQEFMLNELYPPNIRFKINKWYKKITNFDNLFSDSIKHRILTYNVNYLESPNILNNRDYVYNNLLLLLAKSNANVIILQEFPETHIQKLNELKNYYIKYVLNGGTDAYVVALIDKLKCKNVEFIDLEFKSFKPRNSIYIIYTALDGTEFRIVGTHLEIGLRLMHGFTFVDYDTFYDFYVDQVERRMQQINTIIRNEKYIDKMIPQIIIGDMNITEDSKQELTKFKLKQYIQSNEKDPTSIHGKKVDYAFYLYKQIQGTEKTVEYFESDHKPMYFDFEIIDKIKSGGLENDHSYLSITFYTIIILFVILLLYMCKEIMNFIVKLYNNNVSNKYDYNDDVKDINSNYN